MLFHFILLKNFSQLRYYTNFKWWPDHSRSTSIFFLNVHLLSAISLHHISFNSLITFKNCVYLNSFRKFLHYLTIIIPLRNSRNSPQWFRLSSLLFVHYRIERWSNWNLCIKYIFNDNKRCSRSKANRQKKNFSGT